MCVCSESTLSNLCASQFESLTGPISPPKSAQALFVVSSIFNVNLWLKRCSFNGSSKKHKHHHSVCHKVSSFTWAICLFKDSPCRHTLDLNRGGCHVDSRQPGTFCSVLVRALVFYTSLCAFFFFFWQTTSKKTRRHYIKAFICRREDFSWDLSCCCGMQTTFDCISCL